MFQSCSESYQLSTQNLSQIYRSTEKQVRPDFVVYHSSEGSSEVHFRIVSNNLLYTRPVGDSTYKARLKVTFVLYRSFNSDMVSDSGSFVITDINKKEKSKVLTGKFPIKASYPNSYIMKITTEDLNKKSIEDNFVVVDKTNRQGRQNYLIVNAEDSSEVFESFTGKSQRLLLKYNDQMVKNLIVNVYQREFELFPPPFMNHNPKRFDFTPDSSFIVALDENNAFELNITEPTLYHIQVDSSSKEGLTYIRFGNHFPNVVTASQMLEPMRFITTNKEYARLLEEEVAKDAVDEFWISVSASADRARELIRNFYNRVEESNQYFTTHMEGWKTDRGLIFIVFGSPDVIYKDTGGESWIYGNGKDEPTLTFNFTRTYNPFSGNDYRLNRSPEYKNYWYKAVDTWRQGRVYKY